MSIRTEITVHLGDDVRVDVAAFGNSSCVTLYMLQDRFADETDSLLAHAKVTLYAGDYDLAEWLRGLAGRVEAAQEAARTRAEAENEAAAAREG